MLRPESYLAHSIKEYLDRVAARSPAPGGGSCAALSGAMGMALISMVSNYSLGTSPENSEIRTALSSICRESEVQRDRLSELVDLDASSFAQVIAAYKLPKGTDSEREVRSDAVQSALRAATTVSFEVAERSSLGIQELSTGLAEHADAQMLGDVQVAAALLHAAYIASSHLVEGNLKSLTDRTWAQEQLTKLQQQGSALDGALERLRVPANQ